MPEKNTDHASFLRAVGQPGGEERGDENVRSLTMERLRRRDPDAPFTAGELAPILNDPDDRAFTEAMATALKIALGSFRRRFERSR